MFPPSLTEKTVDQSGAPKPISSASEVDGDAVFYRARADGTDPTAARSAIFREMLADGRAESSSLIVSLRKAIGLESSAEKDLRGAREEIARVEAIQREWDAIAADIDKFKVRLETARREISAVEEGVNQCRAGVARKIGLMDWPIAALDLAEKLAALTAALHFMKEAEKALIEDYWTQVQDAREFGIAHGVPKSALASLPSRK